MTINVAEADEDAEDNGDSYLEMMPERKTDPSSYMEVRSCNSPFLRSI